MPYAKKVAEYLRSLGWHVRHNKHYVATSPDGRRRLVMSTTPSAPSVQRERIAKELRRLGLDVP